LVGLFVPPLRPQYIIIILFPDMPTAVHYSLIMSPTNCRDGYCPVESVAYGISTSVPGIQPFVTSINMGFLDATNDCIHYIDKLASFGTNGQLIISASIGGYGNTNYVLDDVRHGTGYGPTYSNLTDSDFSSGGDTVWLATNGLITAGVQSAAMLFYDGLETCLQSDASSNCIVSSNITHVTGVSHMAGYICWGATAHLEATTLATTPLPGVQTAGGGLSRRLNPITGGAQLAGGLHSVVLVQRLRRDHLH